MSIYYVYVRRCTIFTGAITAMYMYMHICMYIYGKISSHITKYDVYVHLLRMQGYRCLCASSQCAHMVPGDARDAFNLGLSVCIELRQLCSCACQGEGGGGGGG